MLNDPKVFFEKVLHRTMVSCPGLMAKIMEQDADTNEKFLVDLLSDRLAAFLTAPPLTAIQQEANILDENEKEDDQNILLAMSLGACECWGRNRSCPHCDGRGRSGWMVPDPILFQMLIRPAVLRLRIAATSRSNPFNRVRNN